MKLFKKERSKAEMREMCILAVTIVFSLIFFFMPPLQVIFICMEFGMPIWHPTALA